MNQPRVYLAGQITGASYDTATGWREDVQRALAQSGITSYSPMRYKAHLADAKELPMVHDHPLSTAKGITTRDRNDVAKADLVFMNLLGMNRVSVGCMIELGWADAHRVPVVLVMEDGNPHWHPMVEECVGYIVSTIDVAISLTCQFLLPGYVSPSVFNHSQPVRGVR